MISIIFLSNSDELVTGLVYGGLSKKKRNIFQIGYFLNFNVTHKVNKPPSIYGELSEPYISPILNNKFKLNCLLSLTSILNLSIIEGQKIKDIYKISENFLKKMIDQDNWITLYFNYLLNLLKIIGYEIEYNESLGNHFFDTQTLEFKNEESKNTIPYPYDLLKYENRNKLNLTTIINFFKIFETVLVKNHLSNLNLHLPNQYLLFKKLIIDYFKNK